MVSWCFSRKRWTSWAACWGVQPFIPSSIRALVSTPQVDPIFIPAPKLAPRASACSLVRPTSEAKGTSRDWAQL